MLSILSKVAKQVHYSRSCGYGNRVVIILCQFSSGLLLASSALISSQQYFGEPLHCLQDGEAGDSSSIPERIINSFCFISYTYSAVDFSDSGRGTGEGSRGGNESRHSYYPWVPLVIGLQGLTFLLPYKLWDFREDAHLSEYLFRSSFLLRKEALLLIARYIVRRLNDFGSLTMSLLLSEVTFTVVILGNFFFIDTFLDGNFLKYGYEAIFLKGSYGETVFPKMTKCSFHKFGPSGSLEHRDALCLMTLNTVHEKMYLFLWYWLLLLLLISALLLLRRVSLLLLLAFRRKCQSSIKKIFTNGLSRGDFSILMKKFSFSDWLLAEQIESQVDMRLYLKLLKAIASEIREEDLFITQDAIGDLYL